MSSLRNAVKRVTHKERAQPAARKRFGLLEKHKDYEVDNILIFKEQGLVVRMWDKVSRLKNIVWKGQTPTTLEDTWKDMAGYAMIGMMLQRGTFTNPLEGQVKEERR